jgi:hypothetical protein
MSINESAADELASDFDARRVPSPFDARSAPFWRERAS